MKKPSFEKFNYSLRPAKNIERKMFCETFARLSQIAPLRTYRYLGFGATTFVDFTLIHQRLGITDMISIEGFNSARDRVEFNKPFSCIKMKWGKSNDVLPTLRWEKRTIAWLDYDVSLSQDVLADVSLLVANMRSGSVFAITVDVDFEEETIDESAHEIRMSKLVGMVGEKRVPLQTKGADLAGWGFADTCRTIIQSEIEQSLNIRNGPHRAWEDLRYEQLFNIHYADRAKMLTVGGIILDRKDFEKLSPDDFSDLEFISPGAGPYHIHAPVLTWREVRYLNERLPRLCPNVNHPEWLPEEDRKKYGKVYRYYPAYTEVEI